MRTTEGVLDEYRDGYPEPEHDWRFRAGRMAEEIAILRDIVERCPPLSSDEGAHEKTQDLVDKSNNAAGPLPVDPVSKVDDSPVLCLDQINMDDIRRIKEASRVKDLDLRESQDACKQCQDHGFVTGQDSRVQPCPLCSQTQNACHHPFRVEPDGRCMDCGHLQKKDTHLGGDRKFRPDCKMCQDETDAQQASTRKDGAE